MGKSAVVRVALIRTAPFASFNAFPALKIDLAFMILGNHSRGAALFQTITTWLPGRRTRVVGLIN